MAERPHVLPTDHGSVLVRRHKATTLPVPPGFKNQVKESGEWLQVGGARVWRPGTL
jgi:hypothetical protein